MKALEAKPTVRPIEHNNGTHEVLAFDLGGSHVTAWSTASPLRREYVERVKVDHDDHAHSLIKTIVAAGAAAKRRSGHQPRRLIGVALAAPGPFDYRGGISLMKHKFRHLYGVSVRCELARHFGVDNGDVMFLNDAEAFLLGELNGDDARSVGITLGTGVGSAFAQRGSIVSDGQNVPTNGEVYCLPWRQGTVEDEISGSGILRHYRSLGGRSDSVVDLVHRIGIDPAALTTIARFGTELAEVLLRYILPFHPTTIVLGGSISRSAPCFMPALVQRLGDTGAKIAISTLYDLAALRGAANLWYATRELQSPVCR